MKFLTGDETGILKVVHVERQKIDRFGPQRQGDPAERLCWSGAPKTRESRATVAFESGAVEARHGDTGKVLNAISVAPSVKCLDALGLDLLTVSEDGSSNIVRRWCDEECPVADAEGNGVTTNKFTLPGPIHDAKVDPCNPVRLAFGGGSNDVKLWDLVQSQVVWRAKNVREDYLSLAQKVAVHRLDWATRLAPARSLLISGSTDGKLRVYDCNTQRKPLFELVIGHKFSGSQGSCGYTGVADDTPRPVTCAAVAQVRGGAWSIFVGNTLGVLREYDLRKLPTCTAAAVPPGKKSHLKLADRSMPFKRGYSGIMGSVRALDVHRSGDVLAAVGLGRFAYVFDVRKRVMVSKVFLKQKLCSVLFSAEEKKAVKDEKDEKDEDDAEGGEEETQEVDDAEDDEDAVQEGFSDDEQKSDEDEGELDLDEDEESEEEAPPAKTSKGAKRKAEVASQAKAADAAKPAKRWKKTKTAQAEVTPQAKAADAAKPAKKAKKTKKKS